MSRRAIHIALTVALSCVPALRALCDDACAPTVPAANDGLTEPAVACHDHDGTGGPASHSGPDDCDHGTDSSAVRGAAKSLTSEWSGLSDSGIAHAISASRAVAAHRVTPVESRTTLLPVRSLTPLRI